MPRRFYFRRGFTILEICVVFVIVALLASAVLGGFALIRNSEIRQYVNDLSTYQRSLELFKDKYGVLPGDMHNAVDFWGSDSNCPNTTWDDAPKKITCNGTGNGRIATRDANAGADDDLYESFRAWQHVANAEFLPSLYTGMAGPSGTGLEARVNLNVPGTDIGRVGFMVYYLSCTTCTDYFPAEYKHVLQTGKAGTGAEDSSSAPFLSAVEAYGIDKKVDDGRPSTGKLLPLRTQMDCITTNNPDTAEYNTDSDTPDTCSLLMITGL